MSDTTELLSDASGVQPASGDTPTRAAAKPRARRSGTGLSAKVLPELQKMAAELGISGTGRMRKSQLIAAIQEKQGGVSGDGAPAAPVAEAAPVAAEAAPPAAERPTRTRRERSRTKPVEEPAPQAAEPVALAPEPVAAPAEPVVEQQAQVVDSGQGGERGERESRRERRS
ncbi:MAG: transcription termination factor Rho, partial [Nonomuraea sp.]|nr:transcription termination factor Rho [Nonomuraea sp.]